MQRWIRSSAKVANVGSYSAFAVADATFEAKRFDLTFCRDVERARAARVLAASRWTNASLGPRDAANIELLTAMSRDQQLADEYFDNVNCPERQWEQVGSLEAIRAWLYKRQLHAAQLSAALDHALARASQ